MAEQSEEGRSGFLAFFGLDGRANASETTLWVLPYLGFMLVAFVGLSILVQRFLFTLPVWVHVVAIGVALINLFLLLARIRRSGLEEADQAHEGDDPGEQPPPGSPAR